MHATKKSIFDICTIIFQDNLHQTAGTIESWNNIVKNMDSDKLRIRPDVFVARHKNDIMGRQRAFYEVLKNNEYKVHVSMHLVVYFWFNPMPRL